MALRDLIEAHKELITDRLHTDFGLLDELLASKSLTRPEVATIKEVSNWYGRSGKLLEYVSDKGIYEKFFDALKDTQQTHLANFILSNGERRHEFGDDWPLTEREISILDKNQRILVDLLETCDLLPRLYSREVIYKRQINFLSSKTVSHENNEALLEILRRTSLQNYKKTIHCMHLSKQSHIAKIFEEGGGVVRVRSELETESDVNEVEDELITKFTKILGDHSLEDSARILESTQLRLIALKKGHSIILYFLCKTLAELVNLQEMQTSGKLANVIREMFNGMLSRPEVTNLRTTLYDENFSKGEIGFCCVDAKGELEESCDEDDLSATSNATMHHLPLELLDLILGRVYGHHSSVIRSQLGQPTDEEIFRNMASVDFCWFQRIIRRRFKNMIWRNLKEFYRKRYKRPVICRNTRLYLVENIQTKGLLNRLRCVDCLTDIQTRFVNSGKDKSREVSVKKENLLHLAKSLDDSRYSKFVRCLRESKQTLCTRVVTNGGVVVKVEIQCSNLKTRKTVEEQMVKTLNDLRDKTKSKAVPLEQQLKAENIEILDSLLDKTPVVWLWCHSASDLTKLQTNSDLVLKLFNLETVARPSEIVKAKTVNIDSDRFRKEVGEMDLRDLIEAHNYQIMNRLDPDFGLLDELLASRSLTRKEVTEVKAVSQSYGRSGKLLKYVIDKGIYEKFLNALRNTQQTYLVYFILSNGVELLYISDPVLVETIRTNASKKKKKGWFGKAEKSKGIRGLTILDKELFVVSDYSSEVEVYDSMKFSFSRQWNLRELINPWDIASCNRNKCIYISDYKSFDQSKEILRVDSNGTLIKKWSTGDDYGWGLSVTDESNVILTVYNENKLNEYSPNGQLIREINLSLDPSSHYPFHAIKLINGHFAVCHRIGLGYGGVCTVDANGKLKKSVGGRSGSSVGQMSFPLYLSVDGNGFVMVADQMKSRILLLDFDLKFQREILTEAKYGLRNLWTIHLDEANGRLLVADNGWDNERILIFDFK